MKELEAADVMSPRVLAVRPDLSVHELAAFLTANEISGAPVMDEHGRLLGMVSLSDIARGDADGTRLLADQSDPAESVHGWEDEATSDEMRGLHVEGGGDAFVRGIMTPAAYTVSHHTPVSMLARTMIAGRIHRLLVLRDGAVVGIVTSLDLHTLLTGEAKRRAPAARPTKARSGRPSPPRRA
jgi:CBS domain-containing protein